MVRLVMIFAIYAVSCCSAAPQGYKYNHSQNQKVQNYPPQQETVETKSFYFFSAPDDEDDPKPTEVSRVTSNVRKHQQVVFIKAPEYNAYHNAALSLARQAAETKTQIYLLSKEPDLVDLERRLHEIRSTGTQRPEVHFVKYRTPAEAHTAQQAIKAQYNNLPGTSNSLVQAAATENNGDDDDDLFTAKRPPFLPTGVDVVPGSSYLPPWRGQALA